MLNLETKELGKTLEFLSILGCDLSSLEYIEKDNIFYNSKTFEPIDNLLTYILINYQHPSDLHFYFDSRNKTIGLRVRKNGNLNNTSLTIDSKDNYTTARFENSETSYSTKYFKDIFEKIIIRSSMESGESYDFVTDVSIPIFGNFRLRKVASGHDGLVRILKTDYGFSHDSNIIHIKENPVYVGEAHFINDLLTCNSSITLPTEIKQKVELYNTNLSKMFNAVHHLFENHTLFASFNNGMKYRLDKKMKFILEYMGDNIINVNIQKNYSISQTEMDTVILKYISDNYQDFYDPIFTSFVEDVTKLKIDPTIGEFQTPEAFQSYLISLTMLKI